MPPAKERLLELKDNDKLDEFVVDSFLGAGLSRYTLTYKSKTDSALKLFVVKDTRPIYPLVYEKFQREAEMLDRLKDSPFIINRVTPFRENAMHNDEEKFSPYYAMELMDGNLEELLRDDDTNLSLCEKLAVLVQVVSATIDFHKQGISHRDLYTPNILYKRGDQELLCKVGDFGSAKDIHVPQTNPYFMPMGNDSYSSPEAAVGLLGGDSVSEELMRESDVFALGLMMYEILTGGVSKQEKVNTAIAGVIAMARKSNMYEVKTTNEQRFEFLSETGMPTLKAGVVTPITENDILDSEELATQLTEIMKSMLNLDYQARLSNLTDLVSTLNDIKATIEARS